MGIYIEVGVIALETIAVTFLTSPFWAASTKLVAVFMLLDTMFSKA